MDQSTSTEYQSTATPGAWHFRAPLSLDNRNPWVVLDKDSHVLALVTRSPREANARLIAAAPDLLEAAKALIAWLQNEEGEESSADLADRMLRLQVAITKAEGRS